MLKTIFLAGAMSITLPVLAQETPTMTQDVPASTAAPVQSDPATPDTAAPAETETVTTTAQATPADPATQVAQVVDTEFPSYDKDSNGALSKAEFGSWMVALKTASEPDTKADAPATKTWVGQAFASADKDKSKSVSKTELTGFLSQGQS